MNTVFFKINEMLYSIMQIDTATDLSLVQMVSEVSPDKVLFKGPCTELAEFIAHLWIEKM